MRKKIAKISVITVVLNGSDTIRLTLESVRRQKNINIEHVIIDGESSDNTVAISQEYNPDILVSEKDDGVYYAMQKGAKLATGDLLIFLNAGDVFFDDTVCANISNFFNKNIVDICFGNILPVYQDPSASHDHPSFTPGKILKLDFVKNRLDLWSQSIHHQSIFYRKWIFERASYIALDDCANGEYNLLLAAACWFCAEIKYLDLNISRFALGGISTGNFEKEWAKYIEAKTFLQALYFRGVMPTKNCNSFHNFSENEFHET